MAGTAFLIEAASVKAEPTAGIDQISRSGHLFGERPGPLEAIHIMQSRGCLSLD